MTESAAVLVQEAITSASLGSEGAGAWPVYVSSEPVSGPAEVITTYDTGGADPLHAEAGLRRPTVQVRVRSAQYSSGWAKANSIAEALSTTYNQTYPSGRVVGFYQRGDVMYVGRDDEDRRLFTINFELIRDQSQ